jgi:hypothetical protein
LGVLRVALHRRRLCSSGAPCRLRRGRRPQHRSGQTCTARRLRRDEPPAAARALPRRYDGVQSDGAACSSGTGLQPYDPVFYMWNKQTYSTCALARAMAKPSSPIATGRYTDVGEEGRKPTGKCQANPPRVVFVRSLWGSRRPRPARPKGARWVARRRVIQTIDVGAAQHRWTPRELGGGPRKMCGNHVGL